MIEDKYHNNIKLALNKSNMKKKKKKKKKKKNIVEINRKININDNIINNTNNDNTTNNIINNIIIKTINDINENKQKKIIESKNRKIDDTETIKYNEYEINQLSYDLALLYDKRSYCLYYISLLKIKHNFILTFYNNNDYNSKIVKINLFIVCFALNYAINALFFDDITMHTIYENEGSFDLNYQLPKSIYSSLIMIILNTSLKLLSLSNTAILDFKQIKDNDIIKIEKIRENLVKKIKIKFIFYFIISFIFLLFSWYYLTMFGAIYRNTQIHLLKDTIISFILSLIYPFGIYLLPGLFRIPALSDSKKKREYLYKFSIILQML